MATQINIRLQHKSATVSWKKDITGNLEDAQTPLFTIAETDNVDMQIRTGGYCRIEVQRPGKNKPDLFETWSAKKLSSGNVSDKEHYFTPGYYRISFYVFLGREYHCRFYVEPKQLDIDNLEYIRNYVNGFYNGLSKNILQKTSTSSAMVRSDKGNLFENYSYIVNNYPSFMNTLNACIRKGNTSVCKEKIITTAPKKIDDKSIHWLLTKGVSKNRDLMNPSHLLSAKMRVNRDSAENRYLKNEVQFWNDELKRIQKNFERFKRQIEQEISTEQGFVDDLTFKKNNAAQLSNTRERTLKKYDNDILYRQQSIEKRKEYIKKLEDFHERIKTFNTLTEHILFNSWLKDVKNTGQLPGLKTLGNLRLIGNYRKEYINSKISRIIRATSVEGFEEKGSSELFETFTYITILTMLMNEGFEFTEQDRLDETNLLYKLSHASIMTLQKDEITCKIVYDTKLRKYNSQFEEDEFCTINSSHDKPDFIIAFLKDGKLVECNIVESKWREQKSIYNADTDTESVEHLDDYLNLAYFDVKRNRTNRGIVSKVIMVYPDAEQRFVNIRNDEVIAIGLLPNDNFTTSIGYEKLFENIITLNDLH